MENRHPNLAKKEDTCLVVVDLQAPFLNAMYDRDTVIKNSRLLIQAAKVLCLPVLVTVQNPDKMGDTVAEIKDVLGDKSATSKLSFSCCGSEEFNKTLENSGCKTVIICGVETHICVSQTAHDLLAKGFQVHIPEDAVASRTERNWQTGLEKMRHSGVIITSTEAVIYEMLGCAGTDEFRQILKLVR